MEALEELEYKIRCNTQELYDLTETIRNLDKEIIELEKGGKSSKNEIIRFFDVADRYEEICNKTKTLLDIYFKEAKNLKEPINIVFIKLHKSLNEYYKKAKK